MKIIGKEIKLAIFDLDGTLIDSTGMWKKIDEKFFAKRNMAVPKKFSEHIAHIGLLEAAKFVKNEYNFSDSVEDIIKEWESASLDMYLNFIQLKPSVYDTLVKLQKNGVKIALATVNDSNVFIPCLKRLKVDKFFEYAADINIVKAGKDSPEIYLNICDFLKIKPENALIFEDNYIGLKTGKENNFNCIAVYDEQSEEHNDLKKKYSDLFVNQMDEIFNQ